MSLSQQTPAKQTPAVTGGDALVQQQPAVDGGQVGAGDVDQIGAAYGNGAAQAALAGGDGAAAGAAGPGSSEWFLVTDGKALIRTPPDWASTGQSIPKGTFVEVAQTQDKYSEVHDVGATDLRWTATSNLTQATRTSLAGQLFVVKDKAAAIRTLPDMKAGNDKIPFGTGLEGVESVQAGNKHYVNVKESGGAGVWWTARSNLQTVTSAQGDDKLDKAQLKVVADAIIKHAGTDMGDYPKNAIPDLLEQAALLNMRSANQVAYMLATAEHESKFGQPRFGRSESLVEDHNPYKAPPVGKDGQPVKGGTWSATEHLNGTGVTGATEDELDKNYWDKMYGRKLGNNPGTDDARNFKGRGYVQLTGRDNYAKMSGALNAQGFSYTHDDTTYGGPGNPKIDLVAHPEHVNEVPELASRVLMEGALQGHFIPGQKLGRHVNDTKTDYYNARGVINGDKAKNGDSIAKIAEGYATVLNKDEAWKKVFKAETKQGDGTSNRE